MTRRDPERSTRNQRSVAKRIERRLVALAAILLACAASKVFAQETIKIGYFDIPPHVVGVEDGRPQGAAITYFERYIAPHFNVGFQWNPEVTAPTRLMNQLGSGEIDAMIFLGKTEERTKFFHYPNPYLVLPEMLAFQKEHPVEEVKRVNDLHGLRVGFLVGGRIPQALQDPKIQYDLIAGKRLMQRNLEKLLLGRVDAVYAPLSTALVHIAERMGVRDRIKMIRLEFLPPVEIYTVFSKKTVGEDIVEKYNAALAEANKYKTYAVFLEDYK